jgi:hypothetical protein
MRPRVSVDRSSSEVHVFTRRAESWSALQKELQYFEDPWVFRGQGSAKWNVRCHLDRQRGAADPVHAERSVINEFKRRAHIFLPTSREPETTLEWLALIQHHGGPTRLIDFTKSPLIAVFFALEEAADPSDDCAVWAIDENAAKRRAVERLRTIDPDSSWLQEQHDIAGAVDERLLASPAERFVAPVRPPRVNARMALQQGLFMCLGDPGSDLIANLRTEAKGLEPLRVVRLEFPRSLRPHALWALRRMGITREALFPGLDGFARSLSDQLVAAPSARETVIQLLTLPTNWPDAEPLETNSLGGEESEDSTKTGS